jgi:hypothetical protein
LNAGEEFEINSFNYLRVTFLDAGQSDVNETRGNVFYFFVDRAERLYNTSSNVEKYTFRFFLTLDVWQTYVLQKQKPQKNSDDLISPVLRDFYLEQGNFPYFFDDREVVAHINAGVPLIPDKQQLSPFILDENQEKFAEDFCCVAAFVFDGKIQVIASVPRSYDECISETYQINRLWNAIRIYADRWTKDESTGIWNFTEKVYNVVPLSCYIIPAKLVLLYNARNWVRDADVAVSGGLPQPVDPITLPDGSIYTYAVDFPRTSVDDATRTWAWYRAVRPETSTAYYSFDRSVSGIIDGEPLQFGTLYTRVSIPRTENVLAIVKFNAGATSNGVNITIQTTGNAQPIDVTQNFTVPAPYSEAAQYFSQNGDSIALQNAVSVVSIVASVASQNYAGAAIGAASLTSNLIKQNEIRQRPETLQGSGYGDINVSINGGFAWYFAPFQDEGRRNAQRELNKLQGYLYGCYTAKAFNKTGLLTLTDAPDGVTVGDCLFIRGDAVIYGVNAETQKWLKNKLKTTGLRIWRATTYKAEMA